MQPFLVLYKRVVESDGQLFKSDDLFKGYFLSEDLLLSAVNTGLPLVDFLSTVRSYVAASSKTFGINVAVSTNKLHNSATLQDNVNSYKILAPLCDVISVMDGRGSGLTALYWNTQRTQAIGDADMTLFEILQATYPSVTNETTFSDVYWNSTSEVSNT